ncbi:MAG: YicC family protein [Clostridia bacterium]|nr:YicC family protein [Clostridia bacterium]
MIKSMTGYGRGQNIGAKRDVTVEIKSVNHRYFDCSIRTPRGCTFLEEPIKAYTQKFIGRGKVDVFVSIDTSKSTDVSVALCEPMVETYIEIAKKLESDFGVQNDLTATRLMRMSDVLTVTKEETDEEELKAEVLSALATAVEAHNAMAVIEGEKLVADILLRLDNIEEIVGKIEERSPLCVVEYREKLEARMREVLENVNIEPQRILTEAAIFADKIAVTEETVRLRSHIAQTRDMLASGGAIGRKLDFLIQEFNREANTTGSKANDVTMAQYVVDLKAEIEKIREQIQNIE